MGDISTIIYDDRFVSLAWWCYSSIFVQIFLGRKYQNSLVKQRASVPSQKKKKSRNARPQNGCNSAGPHSVQKLKRNVKSIYSYALQFIMWPRQIKGDVLII